MLEVQLELATHRLDDLCGRLASCSSEWRRVRLSEELFYQRRTVERLKAAVAAEVKP
ncbi:hypothetical protein [Stenotrophomonas sp. HITSZ_GD]|uniref:hypothetical protein n=1 Tax=Stenotrophomonas sp. HITSZ_GD TaxID=3037248 RepID=UPI00240DCF34|nr:hypothetical protein [Stenotrophomonas sp. HITSZ_GD]